MGFVVRAVAALVALTVLVPTGVATSRSGPPALPALPQPPSEHGTEIDDVVFGVFEISDAFTRAPCLTLRIMPADTGLAVDPIMGAAYGAEVSTGAAGVGANLIFLTYPTSCALWIQERVGGQSNEVGSILADLLP